MPRAEYSLLLVLSLWGLSSGCAMSGAGGASSGMPAGPAPATLAGAASTQRGKIEYDATALETWKPPHASAGSYVDLLAGDCQCQAAAQSTLANMIELERQIGACEPQRRLHPRAATAADMKDDLLALRAVEERNRAAGSALELYYRLAEAEAGLDVLAESSTAIDQALANIAALREKGLKVDADEEALRQKKTEQLDQAAQTALARDQAHGALKVLLGLADEDPTRIWPKANLTAQVEPIDVEAAVVEGLSSRAELIILRCLAESLTVQTLPGARAALQQRDASLGTSSLDSRKLHLLLAGARGERELPGRREQIAMLLAERERMATEEIRSAAAAVTTRLSQAALAQQALESRRRNLVELERKRQLGTATPADVSAERLAIIKSQGDLMRAIVAWRIAQVKFKQAQGLLATECGFAHDPCCGQYLGPAHAVSHVPVPERHF